MYEKCARLLGNVFNVTYAIYLLMAQKMNSWGCGYLKDPFPLIGKNRPGMKLLKNHASF